MNIYSSSVILVLFNLPLVIMVALTLKKIRDARLRWLFPGLAFALSLWATPLVLVKADFLSQDAIALCSRITFSGGVIAALLLYLFCDVFGGAQGTKSRYLFGVNALVVLAAVMTGYVEQGVIPLANGFAPIHGPLHKYYVVSVSLTVISAFIRLGMIYRGSASTLLRFQINSIAVYGGIGFLFPIINNGLFPLLIPHYPYPVFGVLGVLFFQFGIFRMLLDGEILFIRRLFDNIKKGSVWQIHGNIVALSRLTNLLNSIFSENCTAFKESYAFVNAAGHEVKMFLQSEPTAGGYGSMALFNEKIMPHWNQGLLDNLVRLEIDNKYLMLNLIKAESIIGGEWLSKPVAESGEGTQLPIAADLSISGYVDQLNTHLAANEEAYGSKFLAFSPAIAKLMLIARECAKTEECILISGEVGSGRKALARAIHFMRGARENIEVVSCANSDINTLVDKLTRIEKDASGNGLPQAVLIADMDAVPVDFLSVFNGVIGKAGSKLRLYFTMNSTFYPALLDTPQLIFENLNRIKLDVPPLRKRGEDIVPLIMLSAARITKATGRNFTTVSREFIAEALAYSWPGNITELHNSVQRAVLVSKEPILSRLHLDSSLSLRLPEGPFSPLEMAERKVISDYLRKNNYNKNRTRLELDITINTLNAKLEKYGIKIP